MTEKIEVFEYDLFGNQRTASLPAHQAHSETSKDAAESMIGSVSGLQAKVLAFVRDHGPCTDEKIAEGLGLNPSTARPRRIELVANDRLVAVGKAKTKSGRNAMLWQIKEQA